MAKSPPVSPLAPEFSPRLPPVAGVRLAGAAIGLKRNGARDLMVAELAEGTTVAAALTRSRCASEPVAWCRRVLPWGQARALVVYAGNANAFTGRAGAAGAQVTAAMAAKTFGCGEEEVLLASIGVIGVPLDHTR